MRILVLPVLWVLTASPLAQAILLPEGTPDPAHPSLYAWFDASDGVGGPGQPTDLSPVTMWLDKSVQAHSLVRTDVDPQRHPTFRTERLAGRPAVQFDGNDYLWADGATEFGTLPGTKTLLVVARAVAADGGYVFDGTLGNGRNALFTGQMADPQKWHVYSGNGAAQPGPDVQQGRWHLHTVRFTLSGNRHFIDGTPTTDGQTATADLIGLTLGSRYTLNFPLLGEIAELLVYDEALTPSDRQAVEGYLLSSYDLPVQLWGDADAISVSSGGLQNLTIEAGAQHANRWYVLLGSASGTNPGLPIDGLVLPLSPDAYWVYTLQSPNQPPLLNSLGILGGAGEASAQIAVPAGAPATAIGLTLHHAFLVIELIPGVVLHVVDTSHAIPIELQP